MEAQVLANDTLHVWQTLGLTPYIQYLQNIQHLRHEHLQDVPLGVRLKLQHAQQASVLKPLQPQPPISEPSPAQQTHPSASHPVTATFNESAAITHTALDYSSSIVNQSAVLNQPAALDTAALTHTDTALNESAALHRLAALDQSAALDDALAPTQPIAPPDSPPSAHHQQKQPPVLPHTHTTTLIDLTATQPMAVSGGSPQAAQQPVAVHCVAAAQTEPFAQDSAIPGHSNAEPAPIPPHSIATLQQQQQQQQHLVGAPLSSSQQPQKQLRTHRRTSTTSSIPCLSPPPALLQQHQHLLGAPLSASPSHNNNNNNNAPPPERAAEMALLQKLYTPKPFSAPQLSSAVKSAAAEGKHQMSIGGSRVVSRRRGVTHQPQQQPQKSQQQLRLDEPHGPQQPQQERPPCTWEQPHQIERSDEQKVQQNEKQVRCNQTQLHFRMNDSRHVQQNEKQPVQHDQQVQNNQHNDQLMKDNQHNMQHESSDDDEIQIIEPTWLPHSNNRQARNGKRQKLTTNGDGLTGVGHQLFQSPQQQHLTHHHQQQRGDHDDSGSLAEWQVRLGGLREELQASEAVVRELKSLVAHAEQQCLRLGKGGAQKRGR